MDSHPDRSRSPAPGTRILFAVNDAWFFVSHRLPIAAKLVALGCEVHVLARADARVADIEDLGCRFHPWAIEPRGRSPWTEVRTFAQLCLTIRRVRPDIVHLVTVKPVLYGGIAARLLRVPGVVYAVSGLGALFSGESESGGRLARQVERLYRFAIGHGNSVIVFQNEDDRIRLQETIGFPSSRTRIIRGSGVDTTVYAFAEEPKGEPVVLMTARLLRDKGVYEFLEAADMLRQAGVPARFRLAGGLVGEGNPASLDQGEVDALIERGVVDLLGQRNDVPELLASCHVYVLPSWREGFPKSVLEASATGRAVVTTDVPGCRDAIIPDVTGLLVPAKDAKALADAVHRLLEDPALRRRLGANGRRHVQENLRVEHVVESHMKIYREIETA